MTQGSFAVGSHPHCDVQVVSLPGGIVVVDAWSRGGTERISDQYDGPTPPFREGSDGAIALPHGQRATLRVGATTIAVGPPRPRAPKRGAAAPVASKLVARPQALAPQVVAAPHKQPAVMMPLSAPGSVAWLKAAERDKASRSTGCSSALYAASPLTSSTSESTCGACSRSTSSSSSSSSRTMSRSRSPRRAPCGQHQEECVAMAA